MMLIAMLAGSAFTQADVLLVRRKCHLPASWISVQQQEGARPRLHLRPSPRASLHQVDCMLGAVKDIAQARGQWPDMGFVGNEAFGSKKPE